MTDVYIPPHPSFMLMSDYMACHEEQQAAKRAQITAQSISRSDSSSEEEQTTTAEQMDIDMASLPSPPASPTEPNWVGMLMEHAQQTHAPLPAFIEHFQTSLNPGFICSVRIAERVEPFCDTTQAFPRKKAAKRHACRVALQWLADHGYINPSVLNDGFSSPLPIPTTTTSLQARDSSGNSIALLGPPSPSSTLSSSPSTSLSPGESAGTRYAALCNEMHINLPRYIMHSSPLAPHLWSGWADFENEPRITGKVAEFRGVFGKRNAKEACQRGVLTVLEELKARELGRAWGGTM